MATRATSSTTSATTAATTSNVITLVTVLPVRTLWSLGDDRVLAFVLHIIVAYYYFLS